MRGEAATHAVREGGQFCGIRDREGECPLCTREQRPHNTTAHKQSLHNSANRLFLPEQDSSHFPTAL